MSLYGSMFSGVSGMSAQGSAIAMSSDNIANLNTVGYKKNSAHFSTFVTGSGAKTGYSSGGATVANHQLIDKQGTMQTTSIETDLAVAGSGMFVVNSEADGTGEYAYTRAGSFSPDKKGNFVNKAGFYLQGWQLDSEGRLPGEVGNLDTTSSSLLESLSSVSTRTISGTASATTKLQLGVNLDSTRPIYQGAGETVKFPVTSINYNIGSKDVIIPDATAGVTLVQGDILSMTPQVPGTQYDFTYGGVEISNDISGGILGATSTTTPFTAAAVDDTFTISTPTIGTKSFVYRSSAPNPQNSFQTLEGLEKKINEVAGLSARIQGNFLYITPLNAEEGLTFTDVTGTFAASLGLANTLPATNRFSTLEGLEKLINLDMHASVGAKINNPITGASLEFFNTDPLGSIISSATALSGVPADHLQVRAQFGLDDSAQAVTFDAVYDAADDTKNMASGNIQPESTFNTRIYDALGTGHDFLVSFIKIANNKWATEVYSTKPEELNNVGISGQVAAGIIEFNGDGTLNDVSNVLTQPITIAWDNDASVSNIQINWGTAGSEAGTVGAVTIGKNDGLGQLASPFNLNYIENNGISPGLLNGVQVDDEGNVIANFSNGFSRKVFKLPLAQFANVNGLAPKTGNVFTETHSSGTFNLKEAKQAGMGSIQSGQLEQANVELADELTKVIIAQRGYQANSKIIKTVNDLLEELNRIL